MFTVTVMPLIAAVAVAVLVMLVVPTEAQGGDECTPCFGTTDAQPITEAGVRSALGLTCQFAANQASNAPDAASPFCQTAQLALYQGCNCPIFDEAAFCPLCQDGFWNIGNNARNRQVPIFPERIDDNDRMISVTCEDILFASRDEPGLCDKAKRAAHYCGCPNAPEPFCTFCDDGTAPQQGEDALLPPSYEQSCRDMHVLAPFYVTTESCEAAKTDLTALFDPDLYCGCMANNETQTGTGTANNPDLVGCDLCENDGESLEYPDWTVPVGTDVTGAAIDMVCSQVSRLAQAATDADLCAQLQTDHGRTCCLGVRPTDSPTTAPPPGDADDDNDASPTVGPTPSADARDASRATTIMTTTTTPMAAVVTVMTVTLMLFWHVCV